MPKKNDKKDKKKVVAAKKKPVAKTVKKAAPKKQAKPAKKAAAPSKKPAAAAKGKAHAAPKKAVLKKAETKAAAKPAPAAKAAKAAPAPKPAEKPAKTAKKELTAKAPEPVEEIQETDTLDAEEAPEEVVLTDAEGRRYCRVKDCDQLSAVDGYCRFHYLLYWKKIQIRKKILSEGKLERYIEELTARYPDKFLDMLRKDLRSEKEFLSAIQELEIDESAVDSEFEDESANYIEEVRGMGEATGARDDEDF